MNQTGFIFEAFRHQLAIVGGGVLNLRALLVGPFVLFENHSAITADIRHKIEHDFRCPIFITPVVNVVWWLLGLR